MAANPQTAGSLAIDGIEVTQTVQDLNHSVTLVAGKATVARVYMNLSAGSTGDVRGEIEVMSPGGTTAITSLNAVKLQSSAIKIANRRHDVTQSLNFALPAACTSPGSHALRLKRIQDVVSGRSLLDASTTGSTSITYQMSEAPPLRLKLVAIRRILPRLGKVEPTRFDKDMILSWLHRAYPVAQVLVTPVTTDAPLGWVNQATAINSMLTSMRNIDLATGTDPRVHYVAIASDGGDIGNLFTGRASVIPAAPDPSAVATAPTGSSNAFPWDRDGCYGDWYVGHELAHTFGREHSGCTSAGVDQVYPFSGGQLSDDDTFVGFDVGDATLKLPMRAYPGTQWHDVTSYCDNVWISSYTYEALLARIILESTITLRTVTGTVSRSQLLNPMQIPTQWLNIIGTVDLTDRSGTIDYVQPLPVNLAANDAQLPNAESRVKVALFGPDEIQILAPVPARLKLDTRISNEEHVTGVVDAHVRRPAAFNLIRVVLFIDNEEVASKTIGSGTPFESLVSRNAAPFEADRFNVQISDDDGLSWHTVAVGLDHPDRHEINPGDFPNTTSVRRRIFATDGLNSRIIRDDRIRF